MLPAEDSNVDGPWMHDRELLLEKARMLVGKTLREVRQSIAEIDGASRVTTKGGAAYVIEEYFGIKKNSRGEPDFSDLGIELKSVPLKEKRGLLTVKEPMSLNMINYGEEYANDDISKSSLYEKNKEMLLVCYIQDEGERSEYRIRYVFLWKMDEKVLAELRPDYNEIVRKIRAGLAHELHQEDNKYLTTCPKHNGDYDDPNDRISKAIQPKSQVLAERRAYRFKNAYMAGVISGQLGLLLVKNGQGTDSIWWANDILSDPVWSESIRRMPKQTELST